MAKTQMSLDGGPAQNGKDRNPWDGICSESCWTATKKWCRCKCGGAHHGEGIRRAESEDPVLDAKTTNAIFRLLKDPKCGRGHDLFAEPIHHYEHEHGWRVKGIRTKRWLYIVCPECGDQVALWKIGLNRDAEIGGE